MMPQPKILIVDDETGKTVTVYIDPRTGERQYVKD